MFEGSSTQASAIDVSSTSNTSGTIIAGGNFLRADAADTTTGALTVDADGGVIVGDAQELTVSVSSNDVTVAQTSQDKDLKFTVNDGGATKTPIQLVGSTGGITLTGDVSITGNLNISGEYNSSVSNVSTYDDAFLKVNTGNSEADAGLIVETGDTDDARMFYDVSENLLVSRPRCVIFTSNQISRCSRRRQCIKRKSFKNNSRRECQSNNNDAGCSGIYNIH